MSKLEVVDNWEELTKEQKYELIAKSLKEQKNLMIRKGDRYENAIIRGAFDTFISWQFLTENLELFNKLFHEWHLY